MSRVVISQPLLGDASRRLEAAGHEVVQLDRSPSDPAELRAAIHDASGLICLLTDTVDDGVLAAAPELKVVANVAVGFDNVDVEAAAAAGVAVANTPGVLTDATADLAFTLLLAAARRVPEGDTFLRAGRYRHWKLDQEQLGVDVFGQTLGIIGLGQIGRAMARRARFGFDMEVLYHDANRIPAADEQALGVRHVPFDELLERSDFVSIHAPLTPETHHLFGKEEFARMRASAILINTARGPLVDEEALASALREGRIAGAGLDVYEFEPQVHPELLELSEHVVLLPHLGSATRRTRERMVELAVDATIDVLAGRRPDNLVTP